ncbi:helix-turn-helix domain-containing protein [Paenibacillus eucommiae]|uniref:AraC-like DNA-binding protein/ABC-type Fe3+-hydroxamate transport system substrate-binding protein n=1 Tax=Paenibacillus eucommiae TaxID=1355755 RepID=A0ABS4IWI4_9BACL|nr:helix-turn-helix domain-containing protein [Paenibacillus eucommiae]MBP1991944.1 AraC-like DNA-binding protein/ABC-type Fe3+-hydroxamate transport system substrate-binding protein [Paenibacillus eucommiae]
MLIDGMLHRIRPFELYLLAPGMILEIPDQSRTYEYYGVFFQPVLLTKSRGLFEAAQSLSLPGSLPAGHVPVSQPQQVLQHILKMYENSRGPFKGDSLSMRLQLEAFMNTLLRNMPDMQEESDDRIDRSLTYIEQHYAGKISVEKLAGIAGMSPIPYSRLFRKVTGLPPVEYMNTFRMEKAKRLISQENSRVKEVAASVGFRSEFYFSRLFQRMVGVSPTVYMKRGTLRVAVASSLGFHDHLQSVGVDPVCVVDLFHYPGMEAQAYAEQLNNQMDQLRQTSPDIIIADHYHLDFRELLKQVAPPVFLDFSVWDWKRNFLKIVELVDREREAAQTLARLEMRTADVGQMLRQKLADERVTIMQVNHRVIGIQGTIDHPLNELIYSELALKSGQQVPVDRWRWEMPPESLPPLETEHLFIQKHHVLAGSEFIFKRLIETSVWNEIHAVRHDHVQMIPNWFVMSWTPRGREQIMNTLMDRFANN